MDSLERTITSLDVAEMVEREHSKVIRDTRGLIAHLTEAKIGASEYFIESTYKDVTGRELPCFNFTKKGCELYSTRMTGSKGTQFAVAYIERFNIMESHIKEQQAKLPDSPRDQLRLMFEFQEETAEKVDEAIGRIAELEENSRIDAGDYGYISRRVNQRVSEMARGYEASKEAKKLLYKDINGGIKQITGVSTRSQLRQKHYDAVIEFINIWQPSTATVTNINQMKVSA